HTGWLRTSVRPQLLDGLFSRLDPIAVLGAAIDGPVPSHRDDNENQAGDAGAGVIDEAGHIGQGGYQPGDLEWRADDVELHAREKPLESLISELVARNVSHSGPKRASPTLQPAR